MDEVVILQDQYNKLREHILTTAIGLLKSFSTLELEEITKKIEECSPVPLKEEEKKFISHTLITHFNDWCVTRKEAEAKSELEKIDRDKRVPKGLTDIGKQKVISNIQKNLNELQACIYAFYVPSTTSAYNDFTSRSTEDIINYFMEHNRMNFFELNQFKKDIIFLLDQYLSNFDDSYHQIYSQYFFKLDHSIDEFFQKNKNGNKKERKNVR